MKKTNIYFLRLNLFYSIDSYTLTVSALSTIERFEFEKEIEKRERGER